MIPIIIPDATQIRITTMNVKLENDFGGFHHGYERLGGLATHRVALELNLEGGEDFKKLQDIVCKGLSLPLYRTTGFCVFSLFQAITAFNTIRDSKEKLDKIICLNPDTGRYKICKNVPDADLFYHGEF